MPAPASVMLGLALSAAGAGLVLRRGEGTRAAALAGLVPAVLASVVFGAPAIAPLALFVLGSGGLTRSGRDRKAAMGAAEVHEGRRGVANVAAKLGLPAVAALAAGVSPGHAPLLACAYLAGLAGAFADTAATETGPLAGGRPVLASSSGVRTVPHGTPGAVSLAGLAAALLAATATGVVGAAVGLLDRSGAAIAAASGLSASILESAVAATSLGRRLGHHGRNAFLSLVATALALALASWTRGS